MYDFFFLYESIFLSSFSWKLLKMETLGTGNGDEELNTKDITGSENLQKTSLKLQEVLIEQWKWKADQESTTDILSSVRGIG